MRALSFALLLVVACEPGVDVERETLTDVGVACLTESGDIEVDFETCLSSSCDELVSSECVATLDGDVLTITSEAVIDSQVGKNVECTDDCGFVIAACTGDTVADVAGITVVIGDSSAALQACPTE